jgi:hypothetical protein
MKIETMNRKKIIKGLEAKEYITSDGKVYFLSANGYLVSLPENYYFKRKEELRKYFSDRDEKEQKRLVLENLSLFASPLPDKEYHPKVEVVYQSAFCTVVKISDYPPEEDDKDVMFKKSLTDARGNVLSDIEENSWNSAKEREDPRIEELCREVLRKLGEGLKI